MQTISTVSENNNTCHPIKSPTAILLAGGLSTRMGCCKQLLPLCGKPLIGYVIETLLEAGITHLVITVNAETQQPITKMIAHLCTTDAKRALTPATQPANHSTVILPLIRIRRGDRDIRRLLQYKLRAAAMRKLLQ